MPAPLDPAGLRDPALRPVAEKVLASGASRPMTPAPCMRRPTCSDSGPWPTTPIGAATATGCSSPPTSTSIRPTSACCATPASSAPSRGCRRRRARTPGRWRRCYAEARAASGRADARVPHRGRPRTPSCGCVLHRHDPRPEGSAIPACTSRRSPRSRSPTWPGSRRSPMREVLIALQGGRPHQPARAAAPRCSARAVRATIADRKLAGEEWLASTARRTRWASRPTARCSTGTWRRPTTAIEHLAMLRALQDETGGFLTYIPLAYHPDHNELGEELGRVGTADDGLSTTSRTSPSAGCSSTTSRTSRRTGRW